MRREIHNVTFESAQIKLDSFTTDIPGWFLKQATVGEPGWFLAHAEDGVIWGRLENGALELSSDVYSAISASLREITLWEARLFGANGEIRVWRTDEGFQARRIFDNQETGRTALDEQHHLWGTEKVEAKGNFTVLIDGQEGLRQIVPLAVADRYFPQEGRHRPVILRWRHYVGYDEHGQARIDASRLVGLDLISRREVFGMEAKEG